MPAEKAKHPIQVVARRTGLSPDVIRIWERRYGAVEPCRSKTHRRLYSDRDVLRLQLLRKATQAGRRIGDVARLDTPNLRELVDTDTAAALAEEPPRGSGGPAVTSAGSHLVACLEAVENLDGAALLAALGRARVELSVPVLFDHLMIPMLHDVGERWRNGTLRPYHEHLASAAVRSVLTSFRTAETPGGHGPNLVVTTPSGQLHELGALMASVVAASEGWDVTFLGPNLPPEEIAGAAVQRESRAVALSVVYPADDPQLPEELRRLRRMLPETVDILLGGRAAPAYAAALEGTGIAVLTDLQGLRTHLSSLRSGAAA